jgi:DNA-binding MarR family transcriptional regulator
MGREFSASQSSMSNVLQRLAAAGVLTFEVRHVAGYPRRLRVYFLTPYGEGLANDLRKRAAARAADLPGEEGRPLS